jgi:hypothetical protein|tara:strand:+ start:3456 stop:4538 length:1083 start_codon:yes stop_codon:yes gene_type:complete
MAQDLNYKNLLNNFIDNGKAYALDVKTRLNNLFLYSSMGNVEEIMFSRNFYNGTLGTTSGNLVGIPNEVVSRITTYYTTLKENISGETTTIQTKLNGCSPSEFEKLYIKNVLYNALEEQLNEVMRQTITVVNSFRGLQEKLTTVIDKLNFITINSYDGQYIDPNGGRVVALQLTGTTTLNMLTTNYNTSNVYLNTFISNHINTTFTKNYPSNGEYLFFSPLIYTNESLTFTFNNRTELEKLLKYRKSTLYDNLIKEDKLGVNGLCNSTKDRFKGELNKIITPWIDYDTSLLAPRFTSKVDLGYETLMGSLNNYYTDFKVGYSINTGYTSENLIRVNLRDKNMGKSDHKFNYKMEEQLYIS